ncbi:MAG: PAS domain-containing protein [Anaerolineae bacterium]|nr:PAS domain-containing protein [Anaerolineae bacterium]
MRQEIIYIIVLILSALVSGGIALYSWRQRRMPAATLFTLMMVGVTVWLLGYAFELNSSELPVMLLWIKVGYLGVATVPTLWFIFTVQYTGRERWLTRRNFMALFIMPLIIVTSVWTNEWHRFYYTDYWVDAGGPFPMFVMTRGIIYWAGVVYAYLALCGSTVLLFRAFIRSVAPYRGQIRVMLFSATFPWVANFLYLTGLNPFPYLNLTPLSFALTGLVIAWGLFRYRLLDVIPVARDKVFESIRDGVIVLDAQTRIVDLNPAARALVARPPSEVIGQPVAQILPGQLSGLITYLHMPELQTQIILGHPPDQQYYDLHVSPLYNRRNVRTGWVAVLHDMTARKQAETTLQERTLELEGRNAELDAFAHTVAHDLKSPLTVIVGFALLMESQVETMSRVNFLENLRRISRTGNKMSAIIDELMLLASVREMKDIDTGPLEMAAIVTEVLDRLRNEITDAGAEVHVPDAWPMAVGYAPWVEEVWANYVNNALKYGGKPDEGTPPHVELGGAILDAGLPLWDSGLQSIVSKIQNPKSKILFWTHDNGPGMTETECTQLFTPFTRLHEVRAQGHGLGLSIVRRIIERLGGEVGVTSEPERGSTFYFTLPRHV